MSEDPVVFFHVMKCGGSSVRAGLATGLTGARHGSDIFELDGEMAKRAAAGKDRDNWTFRDALLAYVLLADRSRVVLGHFRYRDRFAEFLSSSHFVTVLRNPVERMVSLYKYRRYKDDVGVPLTTGFDAFLATPRWSNEGHLYVNTFCGRSDLDPRSNEAIAAAISNLQRFAAVGLTDRMDDFAHRVGQLVNGSVSFEVKNSSPAPRENETVEISDDALETARTICAPDLAVFEAICSSHP